MKLIPTTTATKVMSDGETTIRLKQDQPLTADEVKLLGPKLVADYRATGLLKTQGEVDEADRQAKLAAERQADPAKQNANFGTPSIMQ